MAATTNEARGSSSRAALLPEPSPRASFLFWRRVDVSGGAGACWPWTGARNPKSQYGQFRLRCEGKGAQATPNHVVIGAHRFAYRDRVGQIPDGLYVLHRCDNTPCCNPSHLFLGTAADNMRDMREKGRARNGGVARGRAV